jgi:acetolactate synthase I/II/III large subunit
MAAERKRQEELEADAATDSEGFVNPQRFGKEVGEFFGRDAIVAVDGGDIVSTTARWLQVSTAGQVLDPGLSAPSAPVLRSPSRPNRVPGQAGWAHPRSGAFGFNGFEYDRFVRLGLPIVGVMGQRRGVGEHQNLPQDDVSGTGRRRRSRAPSISRCRLRAGCYAELVTDPEELAPALKRARASGLPSLVNVHIAELNDPAMTQHGFMPRMSSSYSQ